MDHRLLERYFQGKCDPQEQSEVESWLLLEEELPELILQESSSPHQEEWDGFRKRISRFRDHRGRLKWWSMAACLAFLSALTAWMITFKLKQPETAASWKTVSVPNGRIIKLTLMDGSLIELNGGSMFAYPEHFGDMRQVKLLKGEAFFSIAKDTARAFVVQTAGQGQIKVLGTRFNVKQSLYPSRLVVTLNRGSISFSQNHRTFLLAPGQQLSYNLTDRSIASPVAVDTLATAVWRNGTLLFRDTPIKQVFSELEQNFGVKFVIDARIDNQLFTARFDREDLIRILTLIEKGTDLKFKTDGKTIHVSKQTSNY